MILRTPYNALGGRRTATDRPLSMTAPSKEYPRPVKPAFTGAAGIAAAVRCGDSLSESPASGP